jgi:hypothetical protein
LGPTFGETSLNCTSLGPTFGETSLNCTSLGPTFGETSLNYTSLGNNAIFLNLSADVVKTITCLSYSLPFLVVFYLLTFC